MTAFAEIKLGDVLTLQRGFDITKDEQTAGSVPIVSSSGVSSYHNQAKANAPGVVIGRKGTLGTVHFLNVPYWPHDTSLWIKDFKGNDSRFIYYFLQTLKLQNFDVGASNPTLNRNHVHRIKVFFPAAVETQRKIAAVLAAYDDLIEANRRRIALLERMAEEIYREWFVRLRFPAYQKTQFSRGLPVEWSQQKVGQLVDRLGFGRIYREADLAQTGSVVVIDQSTADYLGFYDGDPQHRASVDAPILLFGDHTCKMCFMTKPFSLAENVIPFRPIPGLSAYFLFHLIKGLAETTEYKRHWSELTNKLVLRPTAVLSDLFERQVRPMHEQIELLVESNRTLTRTRDLLLPRLISGKLSVESLPIAFPPSMAAAP